MLVPTDLQSTYLAKVVNILKLGLQLSIIYLFVVNTYKKGPTDLSRTARYSVARPGEVPGWPTHRDKSLDPV